MDEFQEDFLRAHNERRDGHGVPHLVWCTELAEHTKIWAEKMASEERLHHATKEERNYLGENIAMTPKGDYTGEKVTTQWYSEIQHFDYDDCSEFDVKTGHFTQVIWKSTTKVGAAMATTKTGKQYVCARYNPAGNRKGEFEENLQMLDEEDDDINVDDENETEEDVGAITTKVKGKKIRQRKKKIVLDANENIVESPGPKDEIFKRDVEIGVVQHSSTMKLKDGNNVCINYLYQEAKQQKEEDLPPYTKIIQVIPNGMPILSSPAYLARQEDYLQSGKRYELIHCVY